jgi:hydroxypyruvate isomerase
MAIKQSIAWWCYARGEMTPEQLVRTAAEIGYSGAELVPPEHWQLVRDHGLIVNAVVGHASIAEGLNRREHHDRIEREILGNLRQAERWGIPTLLCFSGNRAGLDDQQGAEVAAEGLRRVARAAEEAGVTLVLELLNSKVNHADYQADHTAWGVQVCGMVGSPRVKLLYDIYHMQIMEGDVIRTIQEHNQWFGHYHTAGNPGRHEIDDSQELCYPAIVRAIAATGYDRFQGQEFIPTRGTAETLREAFAICSV